jgi:hypothetical protein
MKMNTLSSAAFALIAGLLVVSGCGSSTTKSSTASTASAQSSTTTPATSPSTASTETRPQPSPENAAFITKADTICKTANAKRDALRTSSASSNSKFLETAASEQEEYAKLAKLSNPSTIAADWKRIIADVQVLAKSTATIASYAQANRLKGVQHIFSTVGETEHDLVAIAKRDGFNNCTKFH